MNPSFPRPRNAILTSRMGRPDWKANSDRDVPAHDHLRLPHEAYALGNCPAFVELWRAALAYADHGTAYEVAEVPLRAALGAFLDEGASADGVPASQAALLEGAARVVMACQAASVFPDPCCKPRGASPLPWDAADAAYGLVRVMASDLNELLGAAPKPFGWSDDPDAGGFDEGVW